MAESETTRKTFYLFPEDLDIISKVAERYRVTDSSALRIILTDWAKADAAPARTLVNSKGPYDVEAS